MRERARVPLRGQCYLLLFDSCFPKEPALPKPSPFHISLPDGGGGSSTAAPSGSPSSSTAPVAAAFPSSLGARRFINDALRDLSELALTLEDEHGNALNVELGDIATLRRLGHGFHGTVSLVKHKASTLLMARKEVELFSDANPEPTHIQRELDVLRKSNACHNVVRFYGVLCADPMSVHIFMEYMDAGSLADLIKLDLEVPDQATFHVAKSVVLGLKFLQEELKTVHRDIKPSNVLVSRSAQVKICDFSISKQLARTAGDTYVGTMHYMAPERMTAQRAGSVDFRADVWSLGITLIEFCNGTYPYPAEQTELGVLQNILTRETPTLSREDFDGDLVDLVALCLKKDASERPTYEQLLRLKCLECSSPEPMRQWLSLLSDKLLPPAAEAAAAFSPRLFSLPTTPLGSSPLST